MTAAISAEWLKLRKRPAVWVLGIVLVALIVVLQYGALFLVLIAQPPNMNLGPGVTIDSLKHVLYPENLARNALSGVTSFGGAIALILGVLAMGSEYGWSTLKTLFTQRPSRLQGFAAKAVAVVVILAVYDVAILLAALGCSLLVGAYFGASLALPSALTLVQAALAAWLILGLWAALGVALSILFRQSALAIGIGLVYSIAVEGILFSILGQFDWARGVESVFPGANATALVDSFGSAVRTSATASGPLVGSTQAVLVLLAYLVAFAAIGAALLRRRDVI